MKTISVYVIVVIVCAIALILSLDAINRGYPHKQRPSRDHIITGNGQTFNYANFSRTLVEQKNNVTADIAQASKECNKQFLVPLYEAMRFFRKPSRNGRKPDQTGKYLIDCTLREMGVVTREGFQVEEYLLQIRKLLLNYTSFDINEQSKVVKEFVSDAIGEQIMKCFYRNENCHPIGSKLRDVVKYDKSDLTSDEYKLIPKFLIFDLCYELMQSYEIAARECKGREDTHGVGSETTWLIVQCITTGNLDRMFEAPFYPGVLYAVAKEAHKN